MYLSVVCIDRIVLYCQHSAVCNSYCAEVVVFVRRPSLRFLCTSLGMSDAIETVRKLIGSTVICTLSDGRKIQGRLLCVDRLYVPSSLGMLLCCMHAASSWSCLSYPFLLLLFGSFRKNMILAECVETRTLISTDYNPTGPRVEKIATRMLAQAMVPGEHLVKVQMDRKVYRHKTQMENT